MFCPLGCASRAKRKREQNGCERNKIYIFYYCGMWELFDFFYLIEIAKYLKKIFVIICLNY